MSKYNDLKSEVDSLKANIEKVSITQSNMKLRSRQVPRVRIAENEEGTFDWWTEGGATGEAKTYTAAFNAVTKEALAEFFDIPVKQPERPKVKVGSLPKFNFTLADLEGVASLRAPWWSA